MEIGLFQLENLAMTPARFVLIDLRRPPSSVHPNIDSLLKQARALSPEEVEAQVRGGQIRPETPTVLLCQDGVLSQQVAQRLESLGHEQVYVVAGGVLGLLSEL